MSKEVNNGVGRLDTNSEKLRAEGRLPEKKPRETGGNKKVSGKAIYIGCIITLSVILAAVLAVKGFMTISEQLLFELPINETDITNAEDAVYSATYESSHMSATVSVSILSGEMVGITLDAYTGIDASRAQTVFDSVMYYQMLNVPDEDVGATPTDIILLKAIEKTLSGAVE